MAKKGVGGDSAQKEAIPTKVYVVSGASDADWDCFNDSPRDTYENWEHYASPQLIGVGSSAGMALEIGIHAMTMQLKEGEFNQDENGEEYLPGQNPVDSMKWVNDKDEPYDETCPLTQQTNRSAGFTFVPEERLDDLIGRPSYTVWLMAEEAGTKKKPTRRYEACVVVYEMTLDYKEVR